MRFPDRPVARRYRRTTTTSRHDQAPAPGTPWDMLRYTSPHPHIKLREVAAAVVAGAAGPPPPQPIRATLRRARAGFRARRRTAERKE
ncbi:hypothetical protein AABB02_01545 [Streptomyces rimosus]|uniref:hypothetical protein n=1 Tax=Streptomyces rimosus TaxID=1927 RepID=UPI0031DFFAC6